MLNTKIVLIPIIIMMIASSIVHADDSRTIDGDLMSVDTETPQAEHVEDSKGSEGNYRISANVSALSTPITSLNHDLSLAFRPKQLSGEIGLDISAITEPSFDTPDETIINQHSLESFLSYEYPVTEHSNLIGGMFYAKATTVPEHYTWAVLGGSNEYELSDQWGLTTTVLAKKNIDHGRVFLDAETELAYHPRDNIELTAHLHRFEEVGQYDDQPSLKTECGAQALYRINDRLDTAISYEQHREDDDRLARWAMVSLSINVHFGL